MRQLLLFFKSYYFVFLFLLLEIIAFYFLFSRNNYQQAKFLKGTSVVQTQINKQQNKYEDFLTLKESNLALSEENSRLYNEIEQLKAALPLPIDSLSLDSLVEAKFMVQPAKVISNPMNLSHSYLTINKGKNDGVMVQDGVMVNNSIIGKVVYSEENFSLVMPIFHLNSKVNSKHLPSKYTGNLEWNGQNFRTVQMNKVPRNAAVEIGDTIVTNQYSKSFPEHTLIGTVTEVDLDDSKNFYQLEVLPFTNFYQLDIVYLIQRKNLEEIQQVEEAL